MDAGRVPKAPRMLQGIRNCETAKNRFLVKKDPIGGSHIADVNESTETIVD
ncbi:hypothetical protein RUM44_010214 [Polyplax serrata]|uniref:Uncharacterized protein n=1 Tax=Polyplax serrata TaxID=468196 RepID=A0ABR1AUW4_POLSC